MLRSASINYLLKSSGGLQMSEFCLVVEFAQGGSVTNRATPSSLERQGKLIYVSAGADLIHIPLLLLNRVYATCTKKCIDNALCHM